MNAQQPEPPAPAMPGAWRPGVARIGLALAWLALVPAFAVLSDTAGFFGLTFAALCAALALLFGTTRQRLWGAVVLTAAVFGAAGRYGGHRMETEVYTTRARMNQVLHVAENAQQALARHARERGRSAASLREAGFANTSSLVRGIELDATGNVVVVLAFAPVAGKTLVFLRPQEASATQWPCRAEGIEPRYLPGRCRGGE
ncbi:MAG: pilin [Betaproteobacteria bacterium]|nr:pilin [Betaproteobacteria bacterium]